MESFRNLHFFALFNQPIRSLLFNAISRRPFAMVKMEVVFSNGGYQSVQEYCCKDFSGNGEQSYSLVVGAVRNFPFILVQGNDDCFTKILW